MPASGHSATDSGLPRSTRPKGTGLLAFSDFRESPTPRRIFGSPARREKNDGSPRAARLPARAARFFVSMTTIIDYGIGNLRSLEKAFAAAGVAVERTGDPARIGRAERLVLPGVGAFGACAAELRQRGLADVVTERARAGVPLLGVCVGMQLLFEASEERTGADGRPHAGLGLLPGRVVRFDGALADADGARLKVPHMGWNRLRRRAAHPVLGGAEPHVYFVHSYHAAPAVARDVLATVSYGAEVPAVVGRANVVGVQFHPEKSAGAGLAMLRQFAAWTPAPVDGASERQLSVTDAPTTVH